MATNTAEFPVAENFCPPEYEFSRHVSSCGIDRYSREKKKKKKNK